MGSLRLSLDASLISGLSDGDLVSTFPDKSDYVRPFSQTSTARGTYLSKGISGQPAISLDGVSQWYYGGGTISQYIGSDYAIVGVVKVYPATNNATIYSNDAVFAVSNGYVGVYLRSSAAIYAYEADPADKSDNRSITNGDIVVFAVKHTGGNLYIAVNGGSYSPGVAAGAVNDTTGVPRIGVDHTSAYFTRMLISQLIVYNDVPSDLDTTFLTLTRQFRPTNIGVYRSAQDRGSRELYKWQTPREVFPVQVPLVVGLPRTIGERIGLQHRDLPHRAGTGALVDAYDRYRATVVKKSLDLGTNLVGLTVTETLRYSLWWVPSGVTDPEAGRGVALILSGGTFTHTRSSAAWPRHPGNVYVEVPVDVEAYDADGVFCESGGTNLITDPAFENGLASYATIGTVAVVQDDLYFRPGVTPNSIHLTADNPLVTGAAVKQQIAVLAHDVLAVSVMRKDVGSGRTGVLLQRDSDSLWYNATNKTWGASVVNLLTNTVVPGREALENLVSVGASNCNITVWAGCMSAAAQEGHVYHLQVEKTPWASSPIVRGRFPNYPIFSDPNASPVLCPLHGTIVIYALPFWNSADVTTTFCWMRRKYDVNNEFRLYYNGATGFLTFLVKAGGVTYTTTVSATYYRGTTIKMVARYVGAAGELGLSQYTIDVFVDGTKGASTVCAALPTPVDGNLDIGNDGTVWAEGAISFVFFSPDVLTNDTIQRSNF